MNTHLTDADRLAIRAKLAQAQGIPEGRWPFRCIAERHNTDNDGFSAFCYRCGDLVSKFGRVPPDPFTDAADNRALVEWLLDWSDRKQNGSGSRFLQNVIAMHCAKLELTGSPVTVTDGLAIGLTADPVVITLAAAAALGITTPPLAAAPAPAPSEAPRRV